MLVTCVNGRWGNMGHEEAAKVANQLSVRLSIPTHYGMFAENTADPMDFVREMDGKNCMVREMYTPVQLKI